MSDYNVGEIVNEVLIGKDGELYLASGNHLPLSYVTGERTISEHAIEAFLENIKARHLFASTLGSRYIHMVAPDKHTVMRKSFPFEAYETPGDIVFARDKTFIFPKAELIALNEYKRSYQKYDSHWTIHGALRAFEIMLQRFGFSRDEINAGLNDLGPAIVTKSMHAEGDLGRKLKNPPSEKLEALKVSFPATLYSNGFAGNNGKLIGIVSQNPRARGRFLGFGNSFLLLFPNIFTYFFEQTILCRTPFLHREVASAIKPDFILTEAVERYLPRTQSDSEAPSFIDMQLSASQTLKFSAEDAAFFGPSLVPASEDEIKT
ncbi:hypothetical protein MMA231_03466 (plasmid) [Asticcacaulis sp. MM231]|uniref:hypothetical protein n=1 Tax=Asticcacaulis sp. MM231 TaxID=3157666 RepID=UPI0032D58D80